MKLNRRDALFGALFGGTMVGLRAIASGLPVKMLLDPRKALADVPQGCQASANAQYVILSTSGAGDPLNANAPGTYDDSGISHPQDPAMAKTPITLGSTSTTAAAPWTTLGPSGANVLGRTSVFHLATTTPVHPKEPQVLSLMGSTIAGEMFPSVLAAALAPCLGTLQTQPISVGAATPSESLSFQGQALPTVPPAALAATLLNPAGELTNLQKLRDSTLNDLYTNVYKSGASPAQRQFVDSLVTSQDQVRKINPQYLSALASIQDNSEASQILAAVALIQMKITPVVAVHFAFGGDNHNDTALANETAQTQSGMASIVSLMQALAAAGLADQVSFATLNVFGRTMNASHTDGRDHNKNHHVSIAIGKGFRGSLVGGVQQVDGDYGAMPIDSSSGAGAASGDIQPVDSLASFARTVMVGVGVNEDLVTKQITTGTIIRGALAS
ncbi:MAG TPA: DUF1501 domain-containing protein [Polyangiaceae bacterium]